jgi:hypothetical protein
MLGFKSRCTQSRIFIRFETSANWKARACIHIHQNQGGWIIPPRALDSLFLASCDTQRYCEVLELPPHGVSEQLSNSH